MCVRIGWSVFHICVFYSLMAAQSVYGVCTLLVRCGNNRIRSSTIHIYRRAHPQHESMTWDLRNYLGSPLPGAKPQARHMPQPNALTLPLAKMLVLQSHWAHTLQIRVPCSRYIAAERRCHGGFWGVFPRLHFVGVARIGQQG